MPTAQRPKASVRKIGPHVSIAGGLIKAVGRALECDGGALQIFPSNPRGWAVPDPDLADEAALAQACSDHSMPIVIHAPYLINLASPDPKIHAASRHNLKFALERGARLGAVAVVVHSGSGVGQSREIAVRRAAEMLCSLLDETPGIDVAVELTAGGGDSVAATVEGLAELLDACDRHPRVRVCLDTCHLYAAGVDWPDPRVLKSVRKAAGALGPGRVAVVHLNNSRDALGSHRDRHGNLDDGTIDLEAFGPFLKAPEWKTAPVIVETPGGAERQAADIRLARGMF